MSSVGKILRQERERQGLILEKIALQTRISPRYLQAIEADDQSGLPGLFFYRSFVRQYAEFLGLDAASVGSELEEMLGPAPDPSVTNPHYLEPIDLPPLPTGTRSSSRSRLPMALVFLVITIIAASGLYVFWQRMQKPPEEHPAPVVTAPAPAPVPTKTVVTPPPVVAEQPPAPQSAPADTPSLEVMATEEVWVSVTADGKEVVSRVLRPGEKRRITGKDKVTLLTGNAGGLVVTANGKLLEPFGPKGQVRAIDVTSTGVEVRTPNKKKPEI
ncbi:MAG: RodZ domain-containing protein [Bryobacteraceae bacterium]